MVGVKKKDMFAYVYTHIHVALTTQLCQHLLLSSLWIRCKELGWQGRLTDTFHTSSRSALHCLFSSGGTSCQRHMVVSYYYFYNF